MFGKTRAFSGFAVNDVRQAKEFYGKTLEMEVAEVPGMQDLMEQIGGYHLVECKGLDEALSIAKRSPAIPCGGTAEVRPPDEQRNCYDVNPDSRIRITIRARRER